MADYNDLNSFRKKIQVACGESVGLSLKQQVVTLAEESVRLLNETLEQHGEYPPADGVVVRELLSVIILMGNGDRSMLSTIPSTIQGRLDYVASLLQQLGVVPRIEL